MSARPSFDLVLGTAGRTAEIERYLDSLARQTYRRFRLVLVDGNADDRLDPLVERFGASFPILRERHISPLAAGRNVGLRLVEADVVAIPDDDNWYPPELLERLAARFAEHEDWDGIIGRTVDERGRRSVVLSSSKPSLMNERSIWMAGGPTIFLRRRVVEAVGFQDELLGLGSGTKWGAADETDYVLRALELGFRLRYEPDLWIYHANPSPGFERGWARKAYLYGRGSGFVMRRHDQPAWFAARRSALLAAEALRNLLLGRPARARYYALMCAGRIRGWFDRPVPPRYPETDSNATIADSHTRT